MRLSTSIPSGPTLVSLMSSNCNFSTIGGRTNFLDKATSKMIPIDVAGNEARPLQVKFSQQLLRTTVPTRLNFLRGLFQPALQANEFAERIMGTVEPVGVFQAWKVFMRMG